MHLLKTIFKNTAYGGGGVELHEPFPRDHAHDL